MEATQGNMTTDIYPALAPNLFQLETCGHMQCVKGDPKGDPSPLPEPLDRATHTSLRVQRPVSSGSKQFSVNFFDGSKGIKVPVKVRSTDTIGKLRQKVLKLRPDLGASLNLIYNGKPVQLSKTLSELQVKPDAMFTSFQKCQGG